MNGSGVERRGAGREEAQGLNEERDLRELRES